MSTTRDRPTPRPSVLAGFRCLLSGLRNARSAPGLGRAYGRYALALVLTSLVLIAALGTGAFQGLEWVLTERVDADLSETARTVIEVVGTVVVVAISLVIAPVLSLVIVGAALPIWSEQLFYAGMHGIDPARAVRLSSAPGDGITVSLRLGMRRLVRLLVVQLLGFGLSFVPVIGVILGPAVSLVGAGWIVGWEMIDPYLSRLGLSIPEQRAVARAHRRDLLGFGVPASAIMAIPVLGPAFFGLIQVAAARLVHERMPIEEGTRALATGQAQSSSRDDVART